jgi:phage baseplate assembly protein V
MSTAPPFTQHLALAAGHGVHLAQVVHLDDPERRSRVKVKLASLNGSPQQDTELWARVCTLFAGNERGAFWMPDVGDEVVVVFVQGDARMPIVLGGLWNNASPPPETLDSQNYLKVVRSRNGNRIVLDDQDGQEKVIIETPGGNRITLADASTDLVTVEDSGGNSATMGATGITVTSQGKVTVRAAQVEVQAGLVTVDAGMSRFSGVVQCDTLITNAVISSSYTPGAGNIW